MLGILSLQFPCGIICLVIVPYRCNLPRFFVSRSWIALLIHWAGGEARTLYIKRCVECFIHVVVLLMLRKYVFDSKLNEHVHPTHVIACFYWNRHGCSSLFKCTRKGIPVLFQQTRRYRSYEDAYTVHKQVLYICRCAGGSIPTTAYQVLSWLVNGPTCMVPSFSGCLTHLCLHLMQLYRLHWFKASTMSSSSI